MFDFALPTQTSLRQAVTDAYRRDETEAVQDMLLKLALQMARDDYETRRERQRQGIEQAKAAGKYQGRQPDQKRRAQVLALRGSGHSINRTAELTGFSVSQVKRICAANR